MGNELTTTQKSIPTMYDRMDPMETVRQMAKWFSDSQMFGVQNESQGAILALACMHEGRSPIDIAKEYHIVKGRLSMRADAMQAKFQEAGGSVSWEVSTEEKVRVVVSHPTLHPRPISCELSLADIKAKGLAGTDTWKKFPRQMLRARAVSEVVRQVAPGIVVGCYTPEEISDGDSEKFDRQAADFENGGQREPVTPDDTPPAPKKSDRAKKVIAAFQAMGVSEMELEDFVGGCQSTEWGEAEFYEFTMAKNEIMKLTGEERKERIAIMFPVAGDSDAT